MVERPQLYSVLLARRAMAGLIDTKDFSVWRSDSIRVSKPTAGVGTCEKLSQR